MRLELLADEAQFNSLFTACVFLRRENFLRHFLCMHYFWAVLYKFQVGDHVRISKVRRIFQKSYLPNFTEEMFTIYKRFARQVPVYKLKDDAGEILDGTFYEAELQKVIKEDDVYRVEKVLRKRKRKGVVEYFVKWKGYPDKFNSWVAEKDILKL